MRQLQGMVCLVVGLGVTTLLTPNSQAQPVKEDPSKPKLKGDVPGKDKKDDKEKEKDDRFGSIAWPAEVGGKKAEEWAKLLISSPDASLRDQALHALPMFGPNGRKIGSSALLHALIKDPDLSVRLAALSTVPNLGFEPGDTAAGIDAMIALIESTQVNTRYEAITALGNCGPPGRKAIPKIASEFGARYPSSWQIRKASLSALGKLSVRQSDQDVAPNELAVTIIIGALKDPALEVRREALTAIMLVGTPGTAAETAKLKAALTVGTTDKIPSIAIWSRVCLMRLEPGQLKPGDPNLTALMKFTAPAEPRDPLTQIEALTALTALFPEDVASKIPELESIVRTDLNPAVAINAINTLIHASAAGNKSRQVTVFLEDVAGKHNSPNVVEACKLAIKGLQELSEMEKKKLKEMKEGKDKEMKKE